MKRLGSIALGASLVLAAAALAPAACTLGLDESLIGRVPDGSSPFGDGAVSEAGSGGDAIAEGGQIEPPASACAEDKDCKPANACLTGKCDLVRKACVYDVCKKDICTSSSCNVTNKTCGATFTPYKFRALTFPVTQGGVGCGNNPARCFVAVHPFVFVGTNNGVVAFSALDPNINPPATIPVIGLGFIPQAMVSSGSRIYFLGSVLGSAPNYRIQVAWADVPSDPFASVITAKTVLATFTKTSADLFLPGIPGEAFLVHSASNFPTAILTAPIADPSKIDPLPLAGFTNGESPVAASGSRMVFQQFTGPGGTTVTFSLETGVGTGTPSNLGDQNPPVGPVVQQQYFAQGPDGSLVWSVAAVNPGPPSSVRTVRVVWLLADGNATKFEVAQLQEVDTYTAAGIPQVVGPIAWIDKDHVLMAHALSSNLSQTKIELVNKATGVVGGKNFTVAFPVGQVGVAASAGYGYSITADSSTQATVSVLAPGCAP